MCFSEPCEVPFNEDWVQGNLTPWLARKADDDMCAMQVGGTHDLKVFLKNIQLENPLHLKTTFTRITIGEDVNDYSQVTNRDDQSGRKIKIIIFHAQA